MASDVLWLEAVGSEKARSRLFRRGDALKDQRQVAGSLCSSQGKGSFCHCQVLTLHI